MMPGGIRLANHPNDGVGIEPRRGTPRRYKRRGMVCVDDGGGRGNLRVAKTPPLQSGICEDAIVHRIAFQTPSITIAAMRIPSMPNV